MRVRSAFLVAVFAGIGGGLAGCPSDSCPLESPQVGALPGSCTEVAGQPVSYPVALCPLCNLTNASCDVTVAGGSIYLDVKMEACSGGGSCPLPPACDASPTRCTFTAPATPGTYPVVIADGQGGQISRTLTVIASGAESCLL